MLFLDGVYIDSADRSRTRFRWVKAPTSDELSQLTHTIAQRVGRYLERQGLLVRDAGNSYLTAEGAAGVLAGGAARKDKWTFITDVIYLDVDDSNDTCIKRHRLYSSGQLSSK